MNNALLHIHDLQKSFSKEDVLKGIYLNLKRYEKCMIYGRNGSGKTTLFRCISGLETFDSGSIALNGKIIDQSNYLSFYNNLYCSGFLGYVFQGLTPWPHLTVIENVKLPLRLSQKLSEVVAQEKAEIWLEKVGLDGKHNEFPLFLSGGQQRRLVLARTLALEPKLLLLDEVTANLDEESIAVLVEILLELQCAVIIITHEPHHFFSVVDNVYELKQGVLEYSEKSNSLRTRVNVSSSPTKFMNTSKFVIERDAENNTYIKE